MTERQLRDRISDINTIRTQLSTDARNRSQNVNNRIVNVENSLRNGIHHSTRGHQIQSIFTNRREAVVGSDRHLTDADRECIAEINAVNHRISQM